MHYLRANILSWLFPTTTQVNDTSVSTLRQFLYQSKELDEVLSKLFILIVSAACIIKCVVCVCVCVCVCVQRACFVCLHNIRQMISRAITRPTTASQQ